MLDFRVSHNDARIKTSCPNFKLKFVDGTRIRLVDDTVVPIDAYVFNEPTEFLEISHQFESMIGEWLIELNSDQLNKLLRDVYFSRLTIICIHFNLIFLYHDNFRHHRYA